MSGRRVPRRAAAMLVAGLVGVSMAPPSASAAPSTAWVDNAFRVDTPNVVRRANIILGSPPLQATQLMPLGNGAMGAAVWSANGFTAQLNRNDTWPNRRSPGQVTIPGLAPLTDAADYSGSVDLYDATFRQSGGGMTATTYVRADKDQLVIDVTGADPNSTQTARVNLQTGRNPTAGADDGIARLAETWVDTALLHRRHRQDVRQPRRRHGRRARRDRARRRRAHRRDLLPAARRRHVPRDRRRPDLDRRRRARGRDAAPSAPTRAARSTPPTSPGGSSTGPRSASCA